MIVRLFSDGGARGNPGIAGGGVVLQDASGRILQELAIPLGQTTNNIAEYEALLAGLSAAVALSPSAIECYLDSELVVKQLTGEYKVKDPELKKRHAAIQELIFFRPVTFTHIRREQNKAADRLANRAMDQQS